MFNGRLGKLPADRLGPGLFDLVFVGGVAVRFHGHDDRADVELVAGSLVRCLAALDDAECFADVGCVFFGCCQRLALFIDALARG